MSDSGPDAKDSITEVAEESFVRERPLQIERGAVLAGRYQVEEVIGKGGSGVVLRVFDRTVQNVVALKVLKSELARDAKWDKRFSRELRLGRPIQHPNVCRIFDIGEADGHRFLTMELATGGSLRDELKRRPALERPIDERLADARAAIEGLAAIHATGVVHRDFKPDNLLRMEDGRLVISDFGLATDAAAGPGVTVMIGTPHYMAPEVLAGEPATARSDVWALGVVLHEILFGRRPERRTASFDGTGRGPPRPSTGVERAVLALLEECLTDVPGERPADAQAVMRLFAQILAGGGRSNRGNRRLVAVASSLAVGACCVGAFWIHARKAVVRARLPNGVVSGVTVTGTPKDWANLSSRVASFGGPVHCLNALNDHTVRVVWGQPRQAVDIDLDTRRTKQSNVVADAYRVSCPDRSPSTGQLVYSAPNSVGAMEIRLSNREDGSEAVPVTSGHDPLWIGTSPAFVYGVDEVHAAVFSLPTMQLRLLSDGEGPMREIGDEAVSPSGDLVGLAGYDERANGWAEVFRQRDQARIGHVAVPRGSRITFGWRDSDVLIIGPTFEPHLSIALLDLETKSMRRLASVPGADLTRMTRAGSWGVFVSRQRLRDAWSYQHGPRERITSDGNVMAAAPSPSGDLLLSERAPDGTMNIWIRGRDGTQRRLTNGTNDATPTVASDGRFWAYADYASGELRMCEWNGACRRLLLDQGLPGLPTIAPGGRRLAFVTQVGRRQMKVVDMQGRLISEWDALPVCGGVWDSDDKVWSVEKIGDAFYWAEHGALDGESTGKRVRFLTDNPSDSSIVDCRAQDARPGSVLFRPVQTEEDERSIVWASPRGQLSL